MTFFKHSTTSRKSPNVVKIYNEYGVAGLGFYWVVLEKLIFADSPVPLSDLVHRDIKGFSRLQATKIIVNSGLFYYDENGMISLMKKVDYGIDKGSLETYFRNLSLCPPSCARVAEGVAERVAEGVAEGVAERVAAGPCELDKEEKRAENIAREAYLIFMEEHCPSLLLMVEPMTLNEYRKLKKWYTEEQIKEVLMAMDNMPKLTDRCKNCYKTALLWLTKRYGNPHGESSKKSSAKFCGLDENGSPIYERKSKVKSEKVES